MAAEDTNAMKQGIRDIVRRERWAVNSESFGSAVLGPNGISREAFHFPGQWYPGPDGGRWDATDSDLFAWSTSWLWVDGRHIDWIRLGLLPVYLRGA